MDCVITVKDGEWTRVAAKDISSRGLAVASVVAVAEEIVATLDTALNQARVGLRVNGQSVGCVLSPLRFTS